MWFACSVHVFYFIILSVLLLLLYGRPFLMSVVVLILHAFIVNFMCFLLILGGARGHFFSMNNYPRPELFTRL